MKLPKLSQVLLTTTLTLAFASSLVTPARAELVSEDVQADSITPESTSGMEEEMVILKKAPAKKIVVRSQALPSETVMATPVALQAAPVAAPQAQASAQATATATATAAAAPSRPSVGSSLDQGMSNKMDDVRNQFENALLRTLDRIKITVDDGAPSATASAQATAIAVAAPVAAPAPAAAAPTTTVINDSVLNATATPANYMTVQSAPLVREDEEEEGTSVARREEGEERNFTSRLRLTPKAGYTSIGSSDNYFSIKSNVTLGIDLEVEVSENFAAYMGYSFAKYDLGLGGNGYGGGYGNPYGYGGSYSTLQYNQNVFELGGRFYILPRESAFRVFVGAGLGLNKGYINYRNSNLNQYQNYGYGSVPGDYELNSWLGIIETGAEFRVARNVSIGANFKYNTVISSSENDRIRNYGFYAGGGANLTQEQVQAGGSLANESFYSLMGAVKVNF